MRGLWNLGSFLRDLTTPSSFAGDPYGWATNQISHAALGGVAAWSLAGYAWGPWIVLLAYVSLEGVQILRGGDWWDAAEDTLFVAAGILWAFTGGTWGLLVGGVLLLLAGVLRRLTRDDQDLQ